MTIIEEENKVILTGWGLTARLCDSCSSAVALLYCKHDNAFLCGPCDSKLHRHSRHDRVWMCEVCEQAPAAFTCKADAANLCTSCDRDIHSANPLARRHHRLPITPFFDSAAAATFRSSSGDSTVVFAGVDSDADVDVDADTWLIPNPNFLYANESSVFDFGSCENQQQEERRIESSAFVVNDSVVPTESNGNLTFSNDANCSSFQNCFDIDFSQPNKSNFISSLNFSSAQPSVSSSDIGVVPGGNANSVSEVSYTFTKSSAGGGGGGAGEIGSSATSPVMDRQARVLRFRERRKNRKFEKTIRYASRKAYAETRPRIKGRFAKRTETNDGSEIEPVFALGSSDSTWFALDDSGYGVVPSF